MNGTTNFILTEMRNTGKQYKIALESAQINGYAESNPTNDIEGYDSKYKLCILLTHAFGLTVKPDQIYNFGIQRINDFDIRFSNEKKGKIKLIARAHKLKSGGIAAFVMPQLIFESNELYTVDGVDNGIVSENFFADKNIFIGKGAGAIPTAAAVLSDLSAVSYNYKYEYKKKQQGANCFIDNNFLIEVYVRFNEKNEAMIHHFEEVYDEYYSVDQNYVTGKINFEKLINSNWINNKSINVILLNDKFN
jgi:homoserine dehydrogenase